MKEKVERLSCTVRGRIQSECPMWEPANTMQSKAPSLRFMSVKHDLSCHQVESQCRCSCILLIIMIDGYYSLGSDVLAFFQFKYHDIE